MKKSLFSVIMLFIVWAVSASAVSTPSAIVRPADTLCNRYSDENICCRSGVRRTLIHLIAGDTGVYGGVSGTNKPQNVSVRTRIPTAWNRRTAARHISPHPDRAHLREAAVYPAKRLINVFQTPSVHYPYGEPTIEPTGQRYLFGGKEREHAGGRNSYDYGPRHLTSSGNWDSPDKLATETPQISPLSYCGGDPINRVDPTGMSTWVLPLGDGRYEIVGGDLDDNDLNIYVGYFDENNTFIKGKSIGETTSITSFYDTDKKEWAKSAIIDSNDLSGLEFLNFIRYETPSLLNYMINARKNQLYDFKSTNAEPNRANLPMYRGMPIGNIQSNQIVYSSARDIGNIAAGYMCAINGIDPIHMRLAFDAYQSYQNKWPTIEGESSRAAQWVGYKLGCYDAKQKIINYIGRMFNHLVSLK